MRAITTMLIAGVALAAVSGGCRRPPPPPRVPVPTADNPQAIRDQETIKPLPPQGRDRVRLDPRPYDDAPLIDQRPPEQEQFVEAYRAVGRPRIAVFVNRTLEGDILPVNRVEPVASVEHTRQATTRVSVETREDTETVGRYRDTYRTRTDRFETDGPGEYRETTDVYLRPGEYDAIRAREIDYGAVETVLADWLSGDGQVMLVSPTLARQKLTDEQIAALESGRPRVLREVAEQLDADVLVQVQARPTRQTREGLELRILAEAMNVRGGESIGRAVVDVPPPLEKTKINKYTRYLARKLMDDMAETWAAAPAEPPPAPATQPR